MPPALALRILPLAARAPLSGVAAVTCCAVSVKLEPGPEPLVVCTTSREGLRSHCEPSMLRMKEETRVLDCAMPSNFRVLPLCLTAVRYTPSGSVRTISSNTCTISGRERCSFSMISMRAINFCFAASRLLSSSFSLASFLICARSESLRCCCASIICPYMRYAAKAVTAAATAATPSATTNLSLRSLRLLSRWGSRFMRGISVKTPQGEATRREQRRGVALHRLRLGARGELHLAKWVALLGGNAHAAGNHFGHARNVGAAAAHQDFLGLLAPRAGGQVELQRGACLLAHCLSEG